ncbi:unnamed protein product [Eruca vesicaria subsp. sativa]|uniref:non-specific serine/threonine protein kinase n=1 Tax=Eruca vesicaria subsp. sativa TaxID=29727 RepID=A0ABC8M791_ERUVS|nr:unnamed protein product [Eruca vesicaria subsp. sativa]
MMKLLILLIFFFPKNVVCQGPDPSVGEFNFNGLLYAAGSANLNNNGLFRLTNSKTLTSGQVFYNLPLRFKGSPNGNVFSFSTTFVFAIVSKDRSVIKGHGLAFVLSPTKSLVNVSATQFLGLFNKSNIGNPENHIVAVELDTVQGPEVNDMDDNHVGIDINSVVSEIAASAGYYKDDGAFRNLSLASGDSMQLWVEYESKQKRLNVTLHPISVLKPKIPLISLQRDLSPYFLESMYVGFTSSTGTFTASHYILAWNFKINGTAQDIDATLLPEVPRFKKPWIQTPKGVLTVSLTTSGVTLLIVLTLGLWLFLKREKILEVLEDWEVQYGPYKFAYKDLHTATKGFKDSELLGKGGFGKVYKGTLPVIIHRDIKPANILLDGDMNAKLGDFGLAKLCDHGMDPQTSHVAGTFGYISPELARTGNASTSSDVFALGVVMLEITCGRRPILSRASHSEVVLTDWVLECWENGDIMQVLDQKIGQDYPEEQVELVLKLGLLCSHPVAALRPNMSSVIQYLDSVAELPHNLLEIVKAREVHGDTEAAVSHESCSVAPLSFTESFVFHGR